MVISIIVKTLGGLVFIYGSFFGAFLLLLQQGIATLINHDFYNHRIDTEDFGLLYLKLKRILNEIAYNLYKSNFDEHQIEQVKSKFLELADNAAMESLLLRRKEFVPRLLSLVRGLAVVGALLFFLAMKYYKLNNAKKESKVKSE
ncbi:unnamed protein product [Cochlearia groenlandica]